MQLKDVITKEKLNRFYEKIKDALGKAHIHENKEVLDKFSSNDSGKVSYDSKNLLNGIELTKAEYDAMVKAGTIDENMIYIIKDDDTEISLNGEDYVNKKNISTSMTENVTGKVADATLLNINDPNSPVNIYMRNYSFYVDPVNGDDGNDGSKTKPFKTIKNVIRKVHMSIGSIEIYLADGDYTDEGTVVFNTLCSKLFIHGNNTNPENVKIQCIVVTLKSAEINGIKFVGNKNQYAYEGFNAYDTICQLNYCKFDDCRLSSYKGAYIGCNATDFSNYHSGSNPAWYGVIGSYGGDISLHECTGSNNVCVYSINCTSNGGFIYVHASNIEGNALINNNGLGRVYFMDKNWTNLGSVMGAKTISVNCDRYNTFLVEQNYTDYVAKYIITNLDFDDESSIDVLHGTNSYITLGNKTITNTKYYVNDTDCTSSTTMIVYGRLI